MNSFTGVFAYVVHMIKEGELEDIVEIIEREIHVEHRGIISHVLITIFSFIFPTLIEVFIFG